MSINSILSVLGSIASLAAIPLSVYLYLRSKEARVARVRREVVKTLSYQIGEGRDLNLFTVRAVISSKLREEGAKRGSISVDEVVEDLVTETMTEPMLDPARKDRILGNLSWLHPLGAISRLLARYPITESQLASWAAQEYTLRDEDLALASRDRAEPGAPEVTEHHSVSSTSTLFGLISALLTILLFAISERELSDLFKNVSRNIPLPEILVGAAGSIVAAMLTIFMRYLLEREPEPGKRSKKRGEQRSNQPPNPVGRADV